MPRRLMKPEKSGEKPGRIEACLLRCREDAEVAEESGAACGICLVMYNTLVIGLSYSIAL